MPTRQQPEKADKSWALPGEKVLQNIGCVSRESQNDSSKAVLGRFFITNYRIKFIENGTQKNLPELYDSSSIPFGYVKTLAMTVGNNLTMDISTKDQRIQRFKFSTPQQCNSSYDYIIKSTQIRIHSSLFAYKLKEGFIKKGETLYHISNTKMKQIVMNEYLRMGAPQKYQLFEINQNIINYQNLNWTNQTGIFVPPGCN